MTDPTGSGSPFFEKMAFASSLNFFSVFAPVLLAKNGVTILPFSQSSMAGWKTCAGVMLPYFWSSCIHPLKAPGISTERIPFPGMPPLAR
jgi:hypothetical protein